MLKSKKVNADSIKTSMVPEISVNAQWAPIEIDNQFEFLKEDELADTLLKHTKSSSSGILFGSDY